MLSGTVVLEEVRTLLKNTQQGYIIDVKSFPAVIANIDAKEGLLEDLNEQCAENADAGVQDLRVQINSQYGSISGVVSPQPRQFIKGGSMAHPVRDQVFISYSHKDREWLDRLQTAIKPLVRRGIIKTWADTQIEPGAKWGEEINKALASAKVAVLLVSQNFLESDFIANDELPPLLDAAEKEGLIILWIAVSASMYKETEIATYQAANLPSEPLDGLTPSNLNKELVRIGELIKKKAGLS